MAEERRDGEQRRVQDREQDRDRANLDQFLIGKFAGRLDFQDRMLRDIRDDIREARASQDRSLQTFVAATEIRLRKLEDGKLAFLVLAGFLGLAGGSVWTVVKLFAAK
jgi:hypothetical protein